MSEPNFNVNFGHFKTLTEAQKDGIMQGRSAENTNKATKLWVDCLREYLDEKGMPILEEVCDAELPKLLSDFYTEVKKKEKSPNSKKKGTKKTKSPTVSDEEYKNSSLQCMRAALNRYFKEKRGLNIISNETFIQANEMFRGVTKEGRRKGRGSCDHKPPITPEDMEKLSNYFTENMRGPPNAKFLQEIVLFNIIYFMGRRGRENLRSMTKDTFNISIDGNGRKFIHQVITEHDKNHTESDFTPGNEARIYEQTGNLTATHVDLFSAYQSKSDIRQ